MWHRSDIRPWNMGSLWAYVDLGASFSAKRKPRISTIHILKQIWDRKKTVLCQNELKGEMWFSWVPVKGMKNINKNEKFLRVYNLKLDLGRI